MPWLYLLFAGMLEVVWAVGLKHTNGFTRPLPTVITIAAMAASMGLLGLALRHLPIGTAYAVWVGIGVVGTAIWGIAMLDEPATAWRLVFLALLTVSLLGLKLTTPVR